MNGNEIEFDQPIVFVGGSDVRLDLLKEFIKLPIIAVDGGANSLSEIGVMPDYLVGDFDSVTDEIYSSMERADVKIIYLPDQDYTDLEKTLTLFSSPRIYGFGFLDGRFDHTLSVLAQLSKHTELELIGMKDRAVVLSNAARLSASQDIRVSFYSLGQTRVIKSEGLEWSLDGFIISPENMSISNKVKSKELFVQYEGDPLIAIIPAECSFEVI